MEDLHGSNNSNGGVEKMLRLKDKRMGSTRSIGGVESIGRGRI